MVQATREELLSWLKREHHSAEAHAELEAASLAELRREKARLAPAVARMER